MGRNISRSCYDYLDMHGEVATMGNATQQMLETVRKRIGNLQEIERLILEEFGELFNNGTSGERQPKQHQKTERAGRAPSGRKQEIHEWLKHNGPATRAEIISGTQLPGGTVGGYLSSEKSLFENRDGKWHAIGP